MNKIFLLVLSFFFSLPLLCQTMEEALRDAKITSKATLESKFKLVLYYTYPPILQIMGGKKHALGLISNTMDTMKKKALFLNLLKY